MKIEWQLAIVVGVFIILANLADKQVASILAFLLICGWVYFNQSQKKKDTQANRYRQLAEERRNGRERRYQLYLETCEVNGTEPLTRMAWQAEDEVETEQYCLREAGLDRP